MFLISERVWNAHQSWYHERTVKVSEGVTFKTSIRRNAYDDQCFAKAERWDGSQWQTVVSVDISFLDCKSVSYVQKDITKKNFSADSKRLLDEALTVTGNK